MTLTIATMVYCVVARSEMFPVGLLFVWILAGLNLAFVTVEAVTGLNIQIAVLAIAVEIMSLSPECRVNGPSELTQVAFREGVVVMLGVTQAVETTISQEYYRDHTLRQTWVRVPSKRTKGLTMEPFHALKCWYIKILPHRVRSVCWGSALHM